MGEFSQESRINSIIREKLEHKNIEKEILHTFKLLKKYYFNHGYTPVWIKDGQISKQARQMLKAIKTVEDEGLDPRDYHQDLIEKKMLIFHIMVGGHILIKKKLIESKRGLQYQFYYQTWD